MLKGGYTFKNYSVALQYKERDAGLVLPISHIAKL